MSTRLELRHVTEEDMPVLDAFELPEEQVQFTSMPGAYKEAKGGEHRIVILHDKTPVGFFLLYSSDRVKNYSGNPRALLLKALSINRKDQGNGYATEAMRLLRPFTAEAFPECNEIVLTVNRRNTAAQHLYVKTGFHDTGIRKMGPVGEQYVMRLVL